MPGISATAARLDGDSVVGELRGWDERQLILATPSGEQAVAIDELVSLRLAAVSSDGDEEPASYVELTDGTLLPADDIRVAGGRLSMTVAAPGSDQKEPLIVPARLVAAVRLTALKPAAAELWQEIRNERHSSDVLVIAKRRGETLDYLPGVLGDVTEDNIEFKYDGEPLQIDREKVTGFIYFRRLAETSPEPRCILHGRSGLRASASSVRLAEDVLHITTLTGVKFDWPLADVEFADFSAGKIRYVSDIAESTARWTPLVTLPSGATQAAEFGKPRRDRSAFGGPLTLLVPDAESTDSPAHERTFSKGLSLRSRTEMAYRLPAGFTRFTAIAGIEPATSTTGNVQLSIYGDDRPLLEAAISGDDPPREIDLDIAGIKRLKIVVDFGKNLDTGDWLNLCDARLVK
jgi:NPCBM/NEW2 domain